MSWVVLGALVAFLENVFFEGTHFAQEVATIRLLLFLFQLMDLQLSDSNFRRHILLQYLILFQYLKGQVKFKR